MNDSLIVIVSGEQIYIHLCPVFQTVIHDVTSCYQQNRMGHQKRQMGDTLQICTTLLHIDCQFASSCTFTLSPFDPQANNKGHNRGLSSNVAKILIRLYYINFTSFLVSLYVQHKPIVGLIMDSCHSMQQHTFLCNGQYSIRQCMVFFRPVIDLI
jgi:hypothetical protein